MTDNERDLISDAWIRKGLGEHASVAAFARFSLQLLGLAAPPDLLAAAACAMQDEITHARLCFGVAARISGRSAGPGPLNIDNVLAGSNDPAEILSAAITEGCVNETISVAYEEVARGRSEDPSIRRVLERIVADEQRHSDLAWRFAEWMVVTRPYLRDIAYDAFAGACSQRVAFEADDSELLEYYGCLRAQTRADVYARTLRETVEPRATALLGRDFATASAL
jgi:hypothetical protein